MFSLEINFSLIDGMPKQVPITTLHPKIPLIKGIKTPFPKPNFALRVEFSSYTFLYVAGF